MDEDVYDSKTWHVRPGAGTGDVRENDPAAPGFTNEGDRVFRSQFQHANHATRPGSEPVSIAQWTADSTQPIRDASHQGRVEGLPPAGTTPLHDRVSYADPLPENVDL
jgi:hypothetical protein